MLFGLLALASILAPLLPSRSGAAEAGPSGRWPSRFDGRPIVPIAPAPEDKELARSFPGAVARFSDGRRQIVLRRVAAATRRLHPASDCFRASGYQVRPAPMRVDARRGASACFTADRAGRSFLVCEQIRAGDGRTWPDISSWYWSALLGTSEGPWLASLTVERD
jgi:hypothetical protein